MAQLMLSRVADTLYWMSRYLERAEHTARLLDVHLHLMLEATQFADERWARLLDSVYVPRPANAVYNDYALTGLLTFEQANTNSIVACIEAARENARHVREQISSEMWEQINRLYLYIRQTRLDRIWNDQPHEFFRSVKEGIHLFEGITDSTMSRGQGWQFIQVGRGIERSASIARLLDCHFNVYREIYFDATVGQDFLEWVGLLKSCTAFEAYCKVYMADLRPNRIIEFLVLNPEFPHSIRYAVSAIHAALVNIEELSDTHRGRQVNRLSGRLRAKLEYSHVDEIWESGLSAYLQDIGTQCLKIHETIYRAYVAYPIDDVVSWSTQFVEQ